MKKLLITAIATAGMAFGLRAADAGFLAGTDFEDGAVPSTGWTIPQDDPGQTLVNTANTDAYSGNVPTQWTDSDHEKFLAVKTTFGKPISLDLATAQAMSDGAYFDSLVKMTVCDEAPAATTYAGAKIMVWAQENADGTATSLWVRASAPNGDGWKSQDFQCTGSFADADAWHRLTIKAIPDIKNAAGPSDYIPGFVVYLDENALKSNDAKLTLTDLNDNAKEFNSTGKLFVSLDQTSTAKNTITGVAFDGQGSLDDVTLTSNAPDFAKDFEFFTIDRGANVTGFHWAITDGESGDATASLQLPYAAGMIVTISGVNCADGYMFNNLTAADTGVTVDGNTFTVTRPNLHGTVNAQAVGVTVGDQKFADLASAFTYLNTTATGAVEMKLKDALASGELASAITIDNANLTSVKIDLAGKTISCATDGYVITSVVPLWITDSATGGKIENTITGDEVTVGAVTVAADEGSPTLTIDAGTFDGMVVADAGSITGGSFKDVNNVGDEDCYFESLIPTGYKWDYDSNNGYYVVSEAPKTGFIMTIVDNATPQYKVNDAADFSTWTETVEVGPGDVVTWKYVPATGYKAISGYNGSETIADADVTVGTAVVLKHVGQGTQADPYLIADVNDLKWVADFVNEPNDTTGVYFQQTADITWTDADGAFAGIGVYGNANKTFKGVYDGDDHFIKNIVLTPAKYSGVFQQVTGGTIKNVTVDTVTFSEEISYDVHAGVATDGKTYGVFDSEIGGAMVIGCIDGGSVLNVTTKGSFGSTDQPTTGSAGGIICRTKGTVTVDSCVNEADLYGAAAKIAGIVVITQAGTLTIKDCANSGDITYVEKGMNTPSEGAWLIDTKGGYAGIIAYTQVTTAIQDCSNTGKISTVPAGCAVGQILAGLRGGTTTATGCSGTDDQLAISVGTVNNLMFATVDSDVATYVAPAAGDSYLVTGKGAAFELAGADETIELDETLANATVTVAAALAGEYEVDHQGNVYSLKKKGGWNPDADPTVPATDVPGIPEALKVVSLKQISVWAQGAGAAGGVEVKPEDVIVEAFLLNCANNPSVVAAEKAKFKFTEFDPANPPTAEAFASKGYNGTVQVKSFSDAACTTEASTGDQLFYRAFLVPTPAQ